MEGVTLGGEGVGWLMPMVHVRAHRGVRGLLA